MYTNKSEYNGGKRKMSVLATPKENSYIIKKDAASKIINSKSTSADKAIIRESALKFAENNLKIKIITD